MPCFTWRNVFRGLDSRTAPHLVYLIQWLTVSVKIPIKHKLHVLSNSLNTDNCTNLLELSRDSGAVYHVLPMEHRHKKRRREVVEVIDLTEDHPDEDDDLEDDDGGVEVGEEEAKRLKFVK